MQDNGFKIGVTVFFLLVSGYYLYPTFQNYLIQSQLDGMSEQEREEYVDENRQTIEWAETNSLALGLDLQGGMHVTLELQVGQLIQELASSTDETFNEALQAARQQVTEQGGQASLVQVFVEEFEARNPQGLLSRYFRDPNENITRQSSNEEVAEYLQTQSSEAIDRAISIVRDRVNRYGVTEPSIQKQGTRRISVELPGVDDEERVRDLLSGTAQLQFRLMANPQQLQQSLQNIISYYQPDTTGADTGAVADTAGVAADTSGAQADTTFDVSQLTGDQATQQQQNPLLQVMQPVGQGPQFGAAAVSDTADVMELLRRPEVQQMLPPGIELMWSASPVASGQQQEDVFYLLAVREQVELAGEVITEARVSYTQQTNQPEVMMEMDAQGTREWARITGANVGKPVAITMDGVVYSWPVVQNRIAGGRSSISGLESAQEAQDIVTVLMSGALPAPLDIIQQRSVGPSLGQEAVQAGTYAIISGFLLVVLFMVFYYRTAGLVADVALLLNVVFIFGILAAFNATLTLPGVAGIVLTIGMAVDANVLIFDRIREEQRTGKTLKAAIDVGYSKALSAIADANITTFFVGVILFSFGVGPIQGFAVTLMAGILSSLFTAIIVTRIVTDWMLKERKQVVSYG